MLFKIVDLHGFEHLTVDTNLQKHCEACDFLANSNTLNILPPDNSYTYTTLHLAALYPKVYYYKSRYVTYKKTTGYFNKPPPLA